MKKTVNFLLIIFCTISLGSCATILNSETHKINVFTNAPNALITVNDSVYTLPATINVKRNENPLTIKYQSEQKSIDSIIQSKLDPKFSALNLITLPAFGVGYWVDLTNQKRFSYPNDVFFNDKDNLKIYELKAERYIAKRNITDSIRIEKVVEAQKKSYYRSLENEKADQEKEFKRYNPAVGKFRFFIAPPTLSLIGLSDKNPNIDQFNNFVGGVGFGFGGDYFYKENKFLTLELSHRLNQFDEFEWSGHDVLARKLDVSFRKAHKINRLEYSYGVSYTYTHYKYAVPREKSLIKLFMSDDERKYLSDSYSAIGFSSLVSYQLTSIIFVGVRYNPSIYSYRSSGNGFDYEHVISIDYRLKF